MWIAARPPARPRRHRGRTNRERQSTDGSGRKWRENLWDGRSPAPDTDGGWAQEFSANRGRVPPPGGNFSSDASSAGRGRPCRRQGVERLHFAGPDDRRLRLGLIVILISRRPRGSADRRCRNSRARLPNALHRVIWDFSYWRVESKQRASPEAPRCPSAAFQCDRRPAT